MHALTTLLRWLLGRQSSVSADKNKRQSEPGSVGYGQHLTCATTGCRRGKSRNKRLLLPGKQNRFAYRPLVKTSTHCGLALLMPAAPCTFSGSQAAVWGACAGVPTLLDATRQIVHCGRRSEEGEHLGLRFPQSGGSALSIQQVAIFDRGLELRRPLSSRLSFEKRSQRNKPGAIPTKHSLPGMRRRRRGTSSKRSVFTEVQAELHGNSAHQ